MADYTVSIDRLTMESDRFNYAGDATRLRVSKVFGILSGKETVAAEFPFSHYPGGNVVAWPDIMEGLDKGHVIQCSLSGISHPGNIVPMYPCFNQSGGLWKELENRIYQYCKDQMKPGAKRTMSMTVEVEYGAADPRFPTAFLVTAKETGLGDDAYLYFKGLKLDRLRITHLPTPAEKVDAARELGTELVDKIDEARGVIELSGWKMEDQYPAHDPPRLSPLTDVPVRPYAALDWLWLVQKWKPLLDYLTDGCMYRHGHAAQFHERQKQLIRSVNRLDHEDYLKSDYPTDTSDGLITGSGKRAAQIDHVWPYDNFGPNLFSNALVASGAFNNALRTTDAKTKWKSPNKGTSYQIDKHL